MDLTAALVNPTAPVTGEVDAAGCNIGVYYGPGTSGGSVSGANVHGANYYGVVVNAAAANVTNSSIRDIGDAPLNGSQHGVGVFYTTLNQDATSTGAAATGTVSGNTFTNYQKGGIVVNGPGASATISGNTVTGQGPVNYIAQNGIQLGRGAAGTVSDNTVTGNAYTGANNASSAGILVFGGGTASHDLELLAEPVLSICCFRFHPPDLDDEERLALLNTEIVRRVRARGRVPSTTRVAGTLAIRPCFINPRTTLADADLLIDDVLAEGLSLTANN